MNYYILNSQICSDTFKGDTTSKITKGASFLSSLNLTEKQMFDLMHVPQTFFYLRIKQEQLKQGTSGKFI